MKENLIKTIGRLIYRREDFIKFMAKDSGIGRNRLARLMAEPEHTQDVKLLLKGYCIQEADRLNHAAATLRAMAEKL